MTPKTIDEMTTAELSDHFERESAKKVIRVTVIVVVIVCSFMALPALFSGRGEALLVPFVVASTAFSLLTYNRICAIVMCVLSSLLVILPVIALAMMPFAPPVAVMVTANIVMLYLSVQSYKACSTLKRLKIPTPNSSPP